ncbi:hypothetical protein STCU_06896 [Strigomonas culicis]|uniref:Uncharacterized protein n=1 Tax=Strigomonas culicis TaxID=28005 RepID=S9U7Y7_9TRYP|nr:hypothetical protein STCU_06896 [Strigomonas culicis]|eukprot:EPY24998.1 hypothetical protein STCU_06896 [Strigomonas culicis]
MARYVAKARKVATHPDNGVTFLDYGLTQLRLLQLAHEALTDFLNVEIVNDDEAGVDAKRQQLAALQKQQREEDEEAMETCFINLEVARVAIQKKEAAVEQFFRKAERGKDKDAAAYAVAKKAFIDISNLHADVHDALALLYMEKDDYNAALEELETELLLYRNLQDLFPAAAAKSKKDAAGGEEAVPPGKVVSVLYQIANCFLKEGDFKGGETKLLDTLAEIETVNKRAPQQQPLIAPELVQELQEMLEDAQAMNKNNTFENFKKEINDQYCADQMEKLPSAEEFYSNPNDKSNSVSKKGGATAVAGGKANPFVSAVPDADHSPASHRDAPHSNSGSCLSMPVSARGEVLGCVDFSQHSASGATASNALLKSHPFMKEVSNLNSNSQSLSIFPSQHLLHHGDDGKERDTATKSSSAGVAPTSQEHAVVHTVVARKKPKAQPAGPRTDTNDAAAKKVRHE